MAVEKPVVLDREARTKVGAFTDAYIDAHASVHGRDRADVIREVLDKWASQQHDIYRLVESRLKHEGT